MSLTESSNKKIIIWLLSGCFVIFSMVVIGGITRLTGSGLSITEWNVIMGAIPPLNAQQWQETFDKYKTIPQYQLVNYHFTLQEFKNIFWWEYLHRLIGRLLSVVFLVPFIFFLITKKIKLDFSPAFILLLIGFAQFLLAFTVNFFFQAIPIIFKQTSIVLLIASVIYYSFFALKNHILFHRLIFLFFLGGLQGFLGWYMVSSGLTEKTSVSHYRLAIHLITAFITYGFTFWLALELIYKKTEDKSASILPLTSSILLVKLIVILVLIQIIYGAFVAGLHAGKIANTWPTMEGEWIPGGIVSMNPWWKNLFENLLTIQFIHRTLALIITVISLWLWLLIRKHENRFMEKKAINFLLLAICVQFILGIFTLLTRVQITLAAFHQIGAFILFSACVFLLFQFRNIRTPNFLTKDPHN